MRDKPLHPRKPVLIEHVSDDIRDLKTTNTHAQQTELFSGRALADIKMADRLVKSNSYDARYFTGDKIDFSKIVDAGIRYIDTSNYLNGPSAGGKTLTMNGFLHTMAILPSGSLSYSTWQDVPYDTNTVTCTRPMDANVTIRQIFYPYGTDFESFTRVGRCVKSGSAYTWTFEDWVPSSGKKYRIRILNNDTDRAILANINKLPNVIFELHLGGQSIVLPNADLFLTGTTIVFEQYSNHTAEYSEASTATPPSKLIRYYTKSGDNYLPAGTNNGWLTAWPSTTTKYYYQTSCNSWMNTVTYSEKVKKESGGTETKTYETQMIASLDTIRTSETTASAGTWYENSMTAVQYKFEVVDREESGGVDGSYKTWMLDIDPEAATRISDFAELLDQHTDPMLTDIVMYSQRKFSGTGGNATGDSAFLAYVPANNAALSITRPASMNGLVKVSITGNTSVSNWYTSLTAAFNISIYVFNENADTFDRGTVFSYVVTADTTPNVYKKYYIVDSRGITTPAGSNGYVSTFESGITYYERRVSFGTGAPDPATMFYTMDGAEENVPATFLQNGTSGKFARGTTASSIWKTHPSITGYIRASRNDTIMVVITSGNHVADAGKVTPLVEFYPDPHDSYFLKTNLSPSAYTHYQLNRIVRPGALAELAAGPDAVATAFEHIVTKMQNHGLFYGAIATDNTDLNSFQESGFYTVNSTSAANMPADGKTVPAGSTTNAALLVMNSKSRTLDSTFLDNGDEKSDRSNSRITQIFIGNFKNGSGTNKVPKLWIRYGSKASDASSYTWSRWVSYRTETTTYSALYNKATISTGEIDTALLEGSPDIVVGGSATDVTVNLPAPTNYANFKFQIEAVNCTIHIKYGEQQLDGTQVKNRMLYPIECDGSSWYVVTVS